MEHKYKKCKGKCRKTIVETSLRMGLCDSCFMQKYRVIIKEIIREELQDAD